jgi:histidine ammonia-lyase
MDESRLQSMNIDDLAELGRAEPSFSLSDEETARVRTAHQQARSRLQSGEHAYGVHTHYGHNVKTAVSWGDFERHQRRLLDYLHVGVGPALSPETVRRALRLQCLKVAEGRSGVHPQVVAAVEELSNGPCEHPVPAYGSLGASGDLIPMAHAVAPAIDTAGVRGPRDVIGLVNTNAMMASLATRNYAAVCGLVERAHEITALVAVALAAPTEHFEPSLFAESNVRQTAQRASGERILGYRQELLGRDGDLDSGDAGTLQERYSVRCAPQILGNCVDLLAFAEERILAEALAVADNPVLSHEHGNVRFQHGGLFYAASLATAADVLDDALQKSANLVDRQVLLLMDGDWSHGLPDNLEIEAGDHLKGIHQLLSSLVQKLKALSTRSHQIAFSAEQHNQDVLPAAMTAHLQVRSSTEVAAEVIRGAHFAARRAALLRLGRKIPQELHLRAWPDYTV